MEELGQEQQMSELSPTGEARGSGSLRPPIPSTHRDREPMKAACWACAPGSGGRRVQGSGGAGPGQVEGAPVKGGGVYSLWQELDPACGRKGPECVLRDHSSPGGRRSGTGVQAPRAGAGTTRLTRTGPGGAVMLRTTHAAPEGRSWQRPRVPADLSRP